MSSRVLQTIIVAASSSAIAFCAFSQSQTITVTGNRLIGTGDCASGCSMNSLVDEVWAGDPEAGNRVVIVAAASTTSNRDEAACLQEALIKQDVMNTLVSNDVLSGTAMPPGKIIMYNYQLDDPRYAGHLGADPNWVKYSVVAYWGYIGQAPQRVIDIHYMYNISTKKFEQFKFKNTVFQGCGIV